MCIERTFGFAGAGAGGHQQINVHQQFNLFNSGGGGGGDISQVGVHICPTFPTTLHT